MAECLNKTPEKSTKSEYKNGIKYSINANLPRNFTKNIRRELFPDKNNISPSPETSITSTESEDTNNDFQPLPEPITKNLIGTQHFSPAKRKLCLNNLRQTSTGFHLDCPKSKYNIKSLLERFDLTEETKSELHTAEGDCLALQKIIKNYGNDFMKYVQYNAQIFHLE